MNEPAQIKPPIDREYFNWEQAEIYSGLSRTFLRRQVATERLTVIRISGRVLIRRDDLDAFLNDHRTTGSPDRGRGVVASKQKSAKEFRK